MSSSSDPNRAGLRPVTLLWLAVAGLAAGFHALGRFDGTVIDWSDPVGWLGSAPPESALAATLRLVGLVLCYWISMTTILYALAGRSGPPPTWLSRVTLPPVRRLVDGALSSGLAASIALAPIAPSTVVEDEPPPVVFEIHEGVPVPYLGLDLADPGITSEPDRPVPRPSAPAPPPTTASPASDSAGAPSAIASDRYAVLPGDSLWAIAARQLEAALARSPSNSEITVYWRQVVESNQSSLRSGDPNLIFPGELVTLPPLSGDQ